MEHFKRILLLILISTTVLVDCTRAQSSTDLQPIFSAPKSFYMAFDSPGSSLSKMAYYIDSIALTFENNYFGPNIVLEPSGVLAFTEFQYFIYGSELRISIYKTSELATNVGFNSPRVNKTNFNISVDSLEYQIIKNSKIETDWSPVLKADNYIDTSVINVEEENKPFYSKGNLLFDASNISNADSISIHFRLRKQKPSMKFHFVKKDPLLSPPYCMGNVHTFNKDISIEKFAQEAYKLYLKHDMSFYRDWPGRNFKQTDKVFEDSKLAFFFRPRADIANDTAFEYRLLTNGKAARWKKSDNIIYAYDLKAGNQYRLEVRYTDNPQYIYHYQFYVPANWYQTGWFKAAIIFVLLLIALLLYFFFKNIRRKRLQAEQMNKMKALSAQLNPHFVFNALGSIQGLLNNGQIENANHYLSGFGKLLRNTLHSTEKSAITLQEEMNNLENYVKLEQLRKNFGYIVTVQEGISLPTTEMLPLLFQPVIENAVKHGQKDNEPFLIEVKIGKKNADLEISISDNGKGFDTSKNHTGQGLKLIKARIDLFNLSNKGRQISQKISSGNNGTTFMIQFINWLNND